MESDKPFWLYAAHSSTKQLWYTQVPRPPLRWSGNETNMMQVYVRTYALLLGTVCMDGIVVDSTPRMLICTLTSGRICWLQLGNSALSAEFLITYVHPSIFHLLTQEITTSFSPMKKAMSGPHVKCMNNSMIHEKTYEMFHGVQPMKNAYLNPMKTESMKLPCHENVMICGLTHEMLTFHSMRAMKNV